MRPLDALDYLKRALTDGGVGFDEHPEELSGRGDDWREVWELFCSAAREPADEPFDHKGMRLRAPPEIGCDLLLHESGVSDGRFDLSLRRQFSFYDDEGDYVEMNALELVFLTDRAPEGRVPEAQRWGYAGRRQEGGDSDPEFRNWAGWVDSWKDAVEASKSFKVLDDIPPVRWVASQFVY
jgi:hypothetical protein